MTGDGAIALSQHGTVAPAILHRSDLYAASALDGLTVQEADPRGAPAHEVATLWQYVAKRVGLLTRDPANKLTGTPVLKLVVVRLEGNPNDVRCLLVWRISRFRVSSLPSLREIKPPKRLLNPHFRSTTRKLVHRIHGLLCLRCTHLPLRRRSRRRLCGLSRLPRPCHRQSCRQPTPQHCLWPCRFHGRRPGPRRSRAAEIGARVRASLAERLRTYMFVSRESQQDAVEAALDAYLSSKVLRMRCDPSRPADQDEM